MPVHCVTKMFVDAASVLLRFICSRCGRYVASKASDRFGAEYHFFYGTKQFFIRQMNPRGRSIKMSKTWLLQMYMLPCPVLTGANSSYYQAQRTQQRVLLHKRHGMRLIRSSIHKEFTAPRKLIVVGMAELWKQAGWASHSLISRMEDDGLRSEGAWKASTCHHYQQILLLEWQDFSTSLSR